MLCGDFNAHSSLWGHQALDPKGQHIEDLLLASDLILLNDKIPTYLHPASGTWTAIDLPLCDAQLAQDFGWQVDSDSHSSDHFPVIIQANKPINELSTKSWKLRKADWERYHQLCSDRLATIQPSESTIADFTSTLITIANECIPKTSGHPKKLSKPWFNDNCRTSIATREEIQYT